MEAIEKEKTHSKFEWFFYIIFLPLIFTLILTFVILSILKVDVVGGLKSVGNQIPIVQKWIPNDEDALPPLSEEEVLKERLDAYHNALNEKSEDIDQLLTALEERDQLIMSMEQKITLLEEQLEEQTIDDQQKADNLRQVVKLYTSMSPSKAAALMEELNNYEAVLILKEMNNQISADILGKMSAKKAADLSILLKDTSLSSDIEIKGYQERIDQLTRELDLALAKSEKEVMKQASPALAESLESFETMDAKATAEIFSQMWTEGNKSDVTTLLKAMNALKRGEILGAMKPEIAAKVIPTILK